MGGSAQREHQKAQATNAQLAREAKRANASSNSTHPEETGLVASNLPNPPTNSAKHHLQQPCNPSSTPARWNPPCSQSSFTAPLTGSRSDAQATTSIVTEPHPSHRTAVAAQSLLQQVQLEMDYDSREDSDSIADIEGDEDIDDSFSDDLLAGSDVEIHDIVPKPAVAPMNKKSIAPPASRASAKAPQVQSNPLANNSADEDEDKDGKSLSIFKYTF